MATVNVYDNDTGLTKTITVDISSAVVNGSHTGTMSYYVTISTTAKDPSGGNVPQIILTDGDFTDDLTEVLQASIVEIFRHILGQYLSSSSSSTVTNSESSVSGLSSASSASSASTRLIGSSSSSSSDSSVSSASSVSSVSSATT